MASIRAQWADALDPSFRAFYGEEVQLLPAIGRSVLNVFSSSKSSEKDSSASGLSKLTAISEQDSVTYEDENQGYDVTYTHGKWGKGTSVSEEMWADDQYNVISRKPRNLARAENRTVEQAAADIFNYGATAGGGGLTSFTAGDAKALFATDHPRTDGGTAQGNYVTSDLAEDSLETALVTMRATLDDKGQLMLVRPSTLLVPPALEKEARILLDSQGRVGTANNDLNPYKGALKLVVWDFLGSAAGGSDTAWYVLDDGLHQLNWFDRDNKGLQGPEYDFDTGLAKWKIIRRWSAGFSGWRGTYGSIGTNAQVTV